MRDWGLALAALMLVCFAAHGAEGQAVGGETSVAEAGAPSAAEAQPSVEERLAAILESVAAARAEKKDLARQLKGAAPGPETEAIEEDLGRVERRLVELQTAFEQLATGGATVESLDDGAGPQAVDWKQELEDVLRPLLVELKRMTERPRAIERLRSEKALYSDRLELADEAIARIDELLGATESEAVREVLQSLASDWKSHRADAQSRLQLVETELERLLAPEPDSSASITEGVREFLGGRGLNIALALGTFALVYGILNVLGRLIGRIPRRQGRRTRGSFARVSAILFRLFTIMVALLAAMALLSARGDWLILGLVILVLFGVVLALRSSLPRFVAEMRILSHMGGVREGERVIYKGIPWQITAINVFSTLHNPLLRGGTIQLPISEMTGLLSRRFDPDEPWFPTRQGDYVMLDGDLFGQVLLQTPEVVQLQVIGATKTWPVADFLALHPRNLSLDGFAIPISFGVDYGHQGDILTTVPAKLRAHIEQALAGQPFRDHLKDLIVDFNEPAASSLDLIIVGVFKGAGAGDYWSIRRFLQRCAVEACNRHGWVIPFNQLTVHLPPRDQDGRAAWAAVV